MWCETKCSHLLVGVAGCILGLTLQSPAIAATFEGSSVKIGDGEAKTFVQTNDANEPAAIGVTFTSGMLSGLPEPPGGAGDVPFNLPMPTTGPKTVVDHVVINWEAHGHPPPKIYDVPHFDFHFYLVSAEHQSHIVFKDDMESGHPSQQPSAELLAAGYKVPPGTAVSQMGVHAVNLSGPEFNGKPFTTTFIYGYHDKQLTFLEPMMTLEYLRSKPSFKEEIPLPQKVTFSGRYPSSYSVNYDAGANAYRVVLEGLK